MKSIIYLFLLTALHVVGPFNLAHAEECEGPSTSNRRMLCEAVNERNAAKQEMQKPYNELMQSLFEEKGKEALDKTQSSWQEYMAASCRYEKSAWHWGAELGTIIAYCQTKRIKQRTEELRAYLNCTENGCPAFKNKE